LHELLKRVQDLVSSQTGKASSIEETLRTALEFYVEKKDPMEKAKRAEAKEAKIKHVETEEVKTKHVETIEAKIKGSESELGLSDIKSVPGQAKSSRGSQSLKNPSAQQNSRFISARLEHAVRLRDQGQCTHQSIQGVRCPERRWLDIHHVKPISEGGGTTLENLTLICRGHHQAIHHSPCQVPMFRAG
jgi:hypothetical protein